MNAALKIFSVAAIVAINVVIWSGLAMPRSMRLDAPRSGVRRMNAVDWEYKVVRPALGVLAMIGVAILTVDAFRRTYEGPRGYALGCAIGGFFTVGLSSLIYYARWGSASTLTPSELYGT